MSYTITDEELNAMSATQAQLNFVASLACEIDNTRSHVNPQDMYHFVQAQSENLKTLLVTVEKRAKQAWLEEKNQPVAQAVPAPSLEIDLLTEILQVVAGCTSREKQLLEINSKLLDAAMVSTAYGHLLRAYYGMLQNAGVQIETTTRNGVVQTYVKTPAQSAQKDRKRAKLAGMQRGTAHAEAV